jgi:hypothetical protein
MNQDPHNAMRCSQFEALLADALDDTDINTASGQTEDLALTRLSNDVRQAFLAHRQDCAVCGPLFAEAQHGMMLLRSLDEAEPPKNLVHNILAATSLAEASESTAKTGGRVGRLARIEYWLRPAFTGMLHSRFAASFAMAFFSVSLTLTLAGVNFGDILKAAKHPSTIPRTMVLQYTQVEAKVTSYYENMRIVYEVETRVQRLKNAVAPKNTNPSNDKPDQQNQNRPAPDRRPEQEENYSQQRVGLITASVLPFRGAHL